MTDSTKVLVRVEAGITTLVEGVPGQRIIVVAAFLVARQPGTLTFKTSGLPVKNQPGTAFIVFDGPDNVIEPGGPWYNSASRDDVWSVQGIPGDGISAGPIRFGANGRVVLTENPIDLFPDGWFASGVGESLDVEATAEFGGAVSYVLAS